MTSGGPRRNPGPAPDPNALRRDRKDDAAWTILPSGGFQGDIPEFPLPAAADADVTDTESSLWSLLWRKPQAAMWAKLGMEFEVAAYVRAFLESVQPEASAGLKNAVLRMSGEIGLSLPGMHSMRWKFSEDEIAAKRSAAAPVRSGPSAKDRLAGLKNAK